MEIGHESHLDFSQFCDTENTVRAYLDFETAIYTDSGRSALRLLVKHLGSKKYFLPAYICASVIGCFPREETVYYRVRRDFSIDLEAIEGEVAEGNGVLFIMQYFGMLLPKPLRDRIAGWKKRYGLLVIEDTTHSIFTAKKTVGDFCICSLRKWFPIPDGGVLYSENPIPVDEDSLQAVEPVKLAPMLLKNLFLAGRIGDDTRVAQLFGEHERALDMGVCPGRISQTSARLLQYLDIFQTARRRQENFEYLEEHLGKLAYSPVVTPGGKETIPFVYPIYVKEKKNLQKYLAARQIFCPVHWPIERWSSRLPESVFEEAAAMNRDILSIPVDQRYTPEDMEKIVEAIGQYDGDR